MAYSWPEIKVPYLADLTVAPLSRAMSSASESLNNSKANKYRRLFKAYRKTINTPFVAKPFEPPERAPLPDHFIVDEVQLGKRKTRLITSNSFKDRATFILPIGHGTDAYYYVNTASFFFAHGVNVRILELEMPEENTHYADGATITEGYDDIISEGILNRDSPVLDEIPDSQPVYLMPHSSSGQSLERVMFSSPDKAAFALENYDHIYQTGTMLDTANSSQRHAPRLSALYLRYSGHPNVSPQIAGTTIADKEWLLGNIGVDDCFFDDISTHATHGQARHLKLAGIKLFNDVAKAIEAGEDLKAFRAVNRSYLHGKADESACPLTIKDYATLLGFRFNKFAKVGHNVAQNQRVDRAILGHALNNSPLSHYHSNPNCAQAALTSPWSAPHAA